MSRRYRFDPHLLTNVIVLVCLVGCTPDSVSDDASDSKTVVRGTVESGQPGSVNRMKLDAGDRSPAELTDGGHDLTAEQLRRDRKQADREIWATEVESQRYERYFVDLWDRLRAVPNGADILAGMPFDRLRLGKLEQTEALGIGIQRLSFGAPQRSFTKTQWAQQIAQLVSNGYRIVESEWHHSAFERLGAERRSKVDFVLHLDRLGSTTPAPNRGTVGTRDKTSSSRSANETNESLWRCIVRGQLVVDWRSDGSTVIPRNIDVRDLRLLTRRAPPAFRPVLTYSRRPEQFASAHPILVYDLDNNGFDEIVISRWNRVYWNEGGGRFREGRLLNDGLPLAESGLIADVNGDGHADFISVDKQGRLRVFQGNSNGRFPTSPIIASSERMPNALAMTAGDVDADGDLDLWVSQYKPSFLEGQMPTPFYDANDGEPSYLMINDGTGRFKDGTEQAGLASKRFRRTYSCSLVDIDDDRDQDLIVVSDYAGVDLYLNDGRGRFSDVTQSYLPERHLFGMAHTIADFNQDGRSDLYAIGMSSTTARRLDQMGLGRADRADVHQMRSSMGYGNRLWLGGSDRFVESPRAAQAARTGWSWGTTTFDFDRDGDLDIYIANGFRSGKSCRDYCTNFWRHDIYSGSSQPNPVWESLFSESMRELDQGAMSWNGYEHNAYLMSVDDEQFVNVGFLLGIGFEYDARAVVGADLDADGQPDLLVAEYRFTGRGFELVLHAYQNILDTPGNWIGVTLRESGPGLSPIGSKIVLRSKSGQRVERLVTGDSFLAQHPNRVHFGLGKEKTVDTIEVVWPNGQTWQLTDPPINRYHSATVPGRDKGDEHLFPDRDKH